MNAPYLWNRLEAANPTSDIGPNGTDLSGGPTYRDERFGKGVYCNGANKSVKFTVGSAHNPDKWSLSIFVDSDFNESNGSSGANDRCAFSFGSSPGKSWETFLALYASPYYVYFTTNQGSGGDMRLTGLDWTAGDKNHLVVLWDRAGLRGGSNKLEIYLNKTLACSSTSALASEAASSAKIFMIGGLMSNEGASASGEPSDCAWDNVMLFSDTLVQDDIDWLYDHESWEATAAARRPVVIAW